MSSNLLKMIEANGDPIHRKMVRSEPVLWLNPAHGAAAEILPHLEIGSEHLRAAEESVARWAPAFAALFPDLGDQGIESPLDPCVDPGALLGFAPSGKVLLKRDDSLPIVGSVKARGGFFEIMQFAEGLARQAGLPSGAALASPDARALFAHYTVAVGSTGNLGLSIGTIAAALGFKAVVHMSRDAKDWKKARLRASGVEAVEHEGDYATAVAAGRQIAATSERSYFVDDENSLPLFLGYAAVARRLEQQLSARGISIDAEHPLVVHLPCGVGGAPGGIAFGLKHVFGDDVHCFFAEPVDAPAMLARLAFGPGVSVYDLGLHNRTAADGLAVPTASELAWALTHRLIAGVYTVADDDLFRFVARADKAGMKLEPSAVAGFPGPERLESDSAGRNYLRKLAPGAMPTHVLWCTGGALVPDHEHAANVARGIAMQDTRVDRPGGKAS